MSIKGTSRTRNPRARNDAMSRSASVVVSLTSTNGSLGDSKGATTGDEEGTIPGRVYVSTLD